MLLPVSLIVATRNRPLLLRDVVESVLDGDAVPAEIVIVDQSDAPATPRISSSDRGCAIRYLPSSERGLSRARNLGAAAAREDLLVFIDDDMRADRGWMTALAAALVTSGEKDIATGRVLAGPEEVPGGFVPALAQRAIPSVYEGRLGKDVLAGGNMAVRRTFFEQVGRFDVRLGAGSRFPAGEDNDFGFRALEAGGRVLFVPAAVLHHRAWRGAHHFLPLRYAYGHGKGGFYMKHLSVGDRHMLRRMFKDVMLRGIRAARRVGHPRLAAGELAYAAGIIHGAVGWMWAMRYPHAEPCGEM